MKAELLGFFGGVYVRDWLRAVTMYRSGASATNSHLIVFQNSAMYQLTM